MGATGISEFTFGFAFLFEQTRRHWRGLRAAPVLPSLRREAAEGWDARLPARGIDYYYQFKLSDYLWARNSKYIRDGIYPGPYYRIALHKKNSNEQHRRLRDKARSDRHTYYVAPEFTSLTTFSRSFLARDITEHSRLIPVVDCDDIHDGDQHYITYEEGLPAWNQHSEPKSHSRSTSGKDIEQLYRRSRAEWIPITEDFAEAVYEKTRAQILSRVDEEGKRDEEVPVLAVLDRFPDQADRSAPLQAAAELVAMYYGATMVIVGEI